MRPRPSQRGIRCRRARRLAGWAGWQVRARAPLVTLRLLARRGVMAGNLTGLLVALGFYPLMSLVVRYAQTPPAAGYGFGASTLVAGLMLTPFSAASFAARRPAVSLARATSANWVIAAATVILGAGQVLFLLDRSGYPPVVATMALTGFGVRAVFAVNPVPTADGYGAAAVVDLALLACCLVVSTLLAVGGHRAVRHSG